MERTPRNILVKLIGIIFFILIILFGYNRFGAYIKGPQIVSISLYEYQSTDALSFDITGNVHNVESIRINERFIGLNDDNTFNEILILSPGINTVDIDIRDPFGKEKKYTYTIYSTASNPPYETYYKDAQNAYQELDRDNVLEPINEE